MSFITKEDNEIIFPLFLRQIGLEVNTFQKKMLKINLLRGIDLLDQKMSQNIHMILDVVNYSLILRS